MNPGETSPPRVPLVIHVGVSGHRHLPDQAVAQVSHSITLVLELLQHQARAKLNKCLHHFASSTPILRCISPLAKGADQLVAEEALAQGYTLQAPLPFHREEYARDFPPGEERERYEGLLDQAESVLELDGSRLDENEAYRQVGLVVLEQSDVLIAILDQGCPTIKKGGTADIVAEARRYEMPVIIIDPTRNGTIDFSWHHSCLSWQEMMEHVVLAASCPFAYGDNRQRADALAQQYFQESWPKPNWLGSIAKPLEYLLAGEGTNIRWDTDPGSFSLGEEWPSLTGEGTPLKMQVKQMENILDRHYVWADKLALYYGLRFRTFGILRFLAMTLLVFGAFLAVFPQKAQQLGYAFQFAGYGCILLLMQTGHCQECHRKFLEYRSLAEHLRYMRALALLGKTMVTARIPIYNQDALAPWVDWHFRNVVRYFGLINAQINSEYLCAFQKLCFEGILFDQKKGQLGFYALRSKTFFRISQHLEYMGKTLFVLGLMAFLLHFSVYCDFTHGLLVMEKDLWELLAQIFPALAPIFFGLRAQGEYERIGTRYQAMKQALREVQRKVQHVETPTSYALGRLFKRCAESMIDEVSDWRILVRHKQIRPYE